MLCSRHADDTRSVQVSVHSNPGWKKRGHVLHSELPVSCLLIFGLHREYAADVAVRNIDSGVTNAQAFHAQAAQHTHTHTQSSFCTTLAEPNVQHHIPSA